MAATIRIAASVGIATTPTIPANKARITSIQMPEKIDAHRPRVPALTFRAVWPTEPPTGIPLKKPEAMLPAPWAMKSRFGSDIEPSRFGADSATPDPWTRTMAAMANATRIRSPFIRLRSGSAGSGIPLGISPMSSTLATLATPRTRIVGMARPMIEA